MPKFCCGGGIAGEGRSGEVLSPKKGGDWLSWPTG